MFQELLIFFVSFATIAFLFYKLKEERANSIYWITVSKKQCEMKKESAQKVVILEQQLKEKSEESEKWYRASLRNCAIKFDLRKRIEALENKSKHDTNLLNHLHKRLVSERIENREFTRQKIELLELEIENITSELESYKLKSTLYVASLEAVNQRYNQALENFNKDSEFYQNFINEMGGEVRELRMIINELEEELENSSDSIEQKPLTDEDTKEPLGTEVLFDCCCCYDQKPYRRAFQCGHTVCVECFTKLNPDEEIKTCPTCRVKSAYNPVFLSKIE